MSSLAAQNNVTDLLRESLALDEEIKRRLKAQALQRTYATFYPWQMEFCAATREYYECCLCAANQIGKTYLGTTIDAMHLTGDYPDDYPGHRFEHAPMCWGLGYSLEKTRDLLQTALFGLFRNGAFEGGLVAADKIHSWESATGVPNAMRSVRVKHRKGIATIQFWSYSQGQHAIMGDVVDWFHVDEEPKDQQIRPQILTRTINGDKGRGGRGIYTFTPENGKTDLVIQFMETPSTSQFWMNKGWGDAPHMTDEKRERLLAQYPAHQRDMRSKGIPMLGQGRIYDMGDEFIACDPFEIPEYFMVINGMDFGWDHPQSQVQLAIDQDADVVYVTQAWKQRQVSANDAWGAVKDWADGVPLAWPQDGLQNEKGRDDAVEQAEHYRRAGFDMLPEWAQWESGSRSVEQGLYEINDRMRKGKFKVFSNLVPWFEEFRQYHRDEKGKIVKVRDDLMDATRYAYMMRRYAKRRGDVGVRRRIRVKRGLR